MEFSVGVFDRVCNDDYFSSYLVFCSMNDQGYLYGKCPLKKICVVTIFLLYDNFCMVFGSETPF